MVILPKMKNPDNGDALEHPIYRYYYDEQGSQVAILDPKGRATLFEYNELGAQTKRYMPFVPTLTGTPDLTDPAVDVAYSDIEDDLPDPHPHDHTWYDAYGRIVKRRDCKDQVTLFYYYAPGDFTTGLPGQLRCELYFESSDPWPDTTVSMPDPSGLSPDSRIDHEYDKLGRKVKEVKDGETWQYAYDEEGRVASLTTPQGTVGYAYSDVTGRRISTYAPASTPTTKVDYGYDDQGRLATVLVDKRNGVDVEEQTQYAYTPNGSLQAVAYANDYTATYTYDALNRLRQLTHRDNAAIQVVKYAYDVYADGQRCGVTEYAAGPTATATITWMYDALNRLTQEAYDDRVGSADFAHDYTYDLVGNRTKKDDGSAPRYYWYNALDQLTKETSDSAGNTPVFSYDYDANGSLTKKYQGTTSDPHDSYGYDLQNRLDEFTPNGGSTTTYAYNPKGIRVEKIRGATTTEAKKGFLTRMAVPLATSAAPRPHFQLSSAGLSVATALRHRHSFLTP